MDPLTNYKNAIDRLIDRRHQVNQVADAIKTVLAFLSSKNPPVNSYSSGDVSDEAKKGGEVVASGGAWPSLQEISEAAKNIDSAKAEAESAYLKIPADQREMVAKKH